MIEHISLTNFKCFKSLSLKTSNLNVFSGMNGAGKSSVIQSLLLLRQSGESNSLPDGVIQLNGALIELGAASEVYCADPTTNYICIEIRERGELLEFKSTQSEESYHRYFLRLDQTPGSLLKCDILKKQFNYVHAERIGPRKISQIPPDTGNFLGVGKWGENAPYIIASERKNAPVLNELILLESSDGKTYAPLQYQWPLWMNRIFPGFDAESEIYSRADQVRLGMGLQLRETGRPLFVRPTNTGFGLSYVLGIIVAGLTAAQDSILIVENPEAHLHPKAQSGLGEFLARVAAGGTQVFVETHSEHVLNGIRRMVKQSILRPKNVNVNFFSIPKGTIEPAVTAIPISEKGDIALWPEGFFDQLDRDLNIILEQ
ncbi:DUF3696 domain-containing protein [Opitutaceae bacterium TAV4]|nr:DUF3696 domain-containing protein [Opitutaceae bacterium TAV4]RRK00194.1 DUF3696 domain-containing protein [Opitutaceae bacterium TAV3]RRK01995.1 DUF3696 domain-containing protein [Opitutaceae bacterium TAV3]